MSANSSVRNDAVHIDAPPSAAAPKLANVASEDLFVPYTSGVKIFLRNKRPSGVDAFTAERIVILMHGATYGGTAFDVAFGGKSWMDYIAERGFDVYALDLPGYGRSKVPAVMEQPADQNEPYMRGTEAVKALDAVVDFVRERRGVDTVSLVGWSWGTTLTATFSGKNQGKVARLVLCAPVWERSTPSLIQVPGKLGAYRVVSREQALARRLGGVPEGKKGELIPKNWFKQWADATFPLDPTGDGNTLRAPNGVVQDSQEYFGATPPKPYYDPAEITSPVLMVVGEWDQDTPPYMALALFPLLKNAAWKRLTILSEGTHSIVMEKNRMLLIRTVQQFLEELHPIGATL